MREPDESIDLSAAQQAAAAAGYKGMMPVGAGSDRPFLDHVLSALADAGCRDVCLVVAPDHGAIRRYYEEQRPPVRVRLSFAVQDRPSGTANALLATAVFVGDDPFLAMNADNLYPPAVIGALAGLDGPGLAAFERDALVADSGFPSERVGAFALLDVDASGRLRRVLEKPGRDEVDRAGPHALVSMNVWRFDRRIFQACQDVPLSARGEYELPEAVALAIARGVSFRAVPARGPVLDLSSRADVAEVTRRLAGQEARP